MKRFFSEDMTPAQGSVRISGDEFTHLKRVLRLRQGDHVAVFNGKGLEVTGTITALGTGFAIVSAEGSSIERLESNRRITLLQGLLKSDKPELVVQKATELGASSIVFFTTARTVAEAKSSGTKETRWRKAAIEAAKQCGRTRLPEIMPVKPLKDALNEISADIKLILWEEKEGTIPLKNCLCGLGPESAIAVAVGPEGGFSSEEIEEARKAGFIAVSIGPRVLRAETAAIAALSIIQYEAGDLR